MKIASLEIDLLANIARLQQDMNRATGVVESAMSRIEQNVQRVQRVFGALGLGLGFGTLVRQTQQLSDAWQGMENRLRLVTGSQQQLARATEDVYRIAMRTSSGLDATAQVYQRFAQNAGALGLSMGQVAALSETVSKSVAVSGASAAAADAALMQFGQALASGVLRGEEFNSIIEQTPSLMQAMATGMGVPLGSMRKLAQEGKLTGDVIVQSLMKAADSVDAQFNTRVKTIAQSWTDLNTALTRYVGEMTRAGGISSTVAEAITSVAHNLDGIGRALIFIAATAIPAAVKALWSLTSAMLAVPGMQLVKVLGVAAGALLAFHDKIKVPEAALQGLGATWDFVGAAFSSGSKVILGALDSLGTGVQSFFNLFASAPAAAASNLQDPFQKAALAIAGVFDQIYAGFTGNLSAMGAALRAMVENGKTAFHSFAEDAVAALRSVADAINSVFKTEISISPYVGPENREYLSIIDEAKRAFEEGQKVLGMRDALVQRIAESTLEGLNDAFDVALIDDHTGAIGRNGEAAGKANSAYQTLIASIRTKIEENQLEIATGDKASEADKLRIKVIQDLAAGKLKLTAAQKQQVDMLLKGLKASESELNISKMVAAAKKKGVDLSADAVKAAYDEARRNEQLAETFGMTAVQVEQLTLARLEEKLAQAESLKLTAEEVKALELLIAAKQKNIAALGNIESREKQKAAWEDWARDVEQIFDRVGQSLTDAIFDGGKSGKELLKDIFKSLTFNVLINPVMGAMQGWVTNQLGGMFGYQNPQQQGGGGILGLAQHASSLNTIGGGIYQALTGASSGASSLSLAYANTVGAFGGDSIGALIAANGGWEGAGAAMASGFSGAMSTAAGITSVAPGVAASLSAAGAGAAGAGAAGAYTMASVGFEAAVGGAAAAGAGAAGAGAAGAAGAGAAGAGAAGAGLGASLAAAGPYVAAAVAVAAAFGLFDDGPPKTRHGQRTTVDYIDGAFGISQRDDRQAPGAEQIALAAAQGTVTAANEAFSRLGIDAAIDNFYAIMESSVLGDRDGVASGGTLRVGDELRNIGIGLASDMTIGGFGGWSDAEMLPRLHTDIQMTVLEAFQSVGDELPGVLSDMLDGVWIRGLNESDAQDLAARFAAVVDSTLAFQAAVESLPFENLRDLSFDAAAGLIAAAGGLDNLNAGMTSYYQTYYSEAEQLDRLSQQLSASFAGIGMEMPDVTQGAEAAKQAFRALFESIDPTTEAGQQAAAVMLSVNQSFAQLVTGMEELDSATRQAAEAAATAARERESLERQWLQINGNTAELRRRDLEALDESNRALQRLIWARQDEAQAAQDAAAAWQQAQADLGTALGVLRQQAQAEITRLQQSFAGTDTAYRAVQTMVQGIERELQGVFDNLGRHIRELRGEVDSTARMQYEQARAVISTALVTGQLPQTVDLNNALQAARDGVAGQMYASLVDQERAYVRLANEMEQLQAIAEPELDTARKTLREAERQYNALRGIADTSSSSLDVLLGQLSVAIAAEESARIQIAGIESQLAWAQAQHDALLGIKAGVDGFPAALQSFASALSAAQAAQASAGSGGSYGGGAAPSNDAYYEAKLAQLKSTGSTHDGINWSYATTDDLKAYFGNLGLTPLEHYEKWGGKHEGLPRPSFAVGINRVPYDMDARIHKDEAVVPAKFNPFNPGAMMWGGGNSELVNEVRALRQQNARLESRLASIERSTGQLADQFDQVTEGGNAMRGVIMEPVEVATA